MADSEEVNLIAQGVKNWNGDPTAQNLLSMLGSLGILVCVIVRKSSRWRGGQPTSYRNQAALFFNEIFLPLAHNEGVAPAGVNVLVYPYAGSVNHDALQDDGHRTYLEKEIGAIIEDIYAKGGKVVVFTAPDRFSRSLDWHRYLWDQLTNRGIRILVWDGNRLLSHEWEIVVACMALETQRIIAQAAYNIRNGP
jgi:hypothetical protein